MPEICSAQAPTLPAHEWTVRVQGQRRRALVFPAVEVLPSIKSLGQPPVQRKAILAFPGSTQTVSKFLTQFSTVSWWQAQGYTVFVLSSRANTGHTWLPVLPSEYDRADIEFVDTLLTKFQLRSDPQFKPTQVWLFGHSGGSCFASLLWWRYTKLFGENLAGLVCNAGWAWNWLMDANSDNWLRAYNRSGPGRAVCLRVGEQDQATLPHVVKNAGLYGKMADRGVIAFRLKTLPDAGHRWLAEDDARLAAWMAAPSQPQPKPHPTPV